MIYNGWVVIVDDVLLDGFHIDVPVSSTVLKHENEIDVKTETNKMFIYTEELKHNLLHN
jgi:hypothetical protein